jgi:hypothetical protein
LTSPSTIPDKTLYQKGIMELKAEEGNDTTKAEYESIGVSNRLRHSIRQWRVYSSIHLLLMVNSQF